MNDTIKGILIGGGFTLVATFIGAIVTVVSLVVNSRNERAKREADTARERMKIEAEEYRRNDEQRLKAYSALLAAIADMGRLLNGHRTSSGNEPGRQQEEATSVHRAYNEAAAVVEITSSTSVQDAFRQYVVAMDGLEGTGPLTREQIIILTEALDKLIAAMREDRKITAMVRT